MPAPTCSAIRAEVKKPKASTTRTKLGTPLSTGNKAGITWYQMNTCTSNGMLRNNSVQVLPKATNARLGAVRKIPIMLPSTSATTSASNATLKVQPQADNIQSR